MQMHRKNVILLLERTMTQKEKNVCMCICIYSMAVAVAFAIDINDTSVCQQPRCANMAIRYFNYRYSMLITMPICIYYAVRNIELLINFGSVL